MRSLLPSCAGRLFAAIALCTALCPGFAGAVDAPPTVSITGPSSGTQFNAGSNITLTATASDSDGTVTSLQFFQGTTAIDQQPIAGPSSNGIYTYTWTNVAAGTYSVTAKATDNGNKSTTSAAITIKVITPTTVVTSPASGAIISGRTATVNGTFTGPDTTTIYLTAGGGHSTLASSGSGSFSGTVDLSPGANNIEVQVARADGTYEIVTRAVTAIDPPVAVMTGPAASASYANGTSVTLTADAASNQSTISRVQFIDGSTVLGEVPSAPYSLSSTLSGVGAHSVFARAVDAYGFTGDSSPIALNITSAPPTVAITAPANGATYRAPASVSFTATASDSDGQVASVQYLNGGAVIGQATSPPYAVTWSNVQAGSYSIIARATDNTGTTGNSAPVSIVVNPNALPTVTLTAPANQATYRAPASISMAATATDSDGTVAKVEFIANGSVVGTVTTAPYQFIWNGVAAGTYTISARATDNDGGVNTSNSASVTVAANVAPSVTLTAPTNGASFTAPATVSLSANASDVDGSVAKVEFFADGKLIGTSTAAPYSVTWANAAAGSHQLTAKVTDNDGATTVSAAVSITVLGVSAAITSPISGSSYLAPASFLVQADVATSSGNITSVDFLDGAVVFATMIIPSGYGAVTVSQTVSGVVAGDHSYTVQGHDDSGKSGTSPPTTVTVAGPPAVRISSPTAGSFFIAPAALTISGDVTVGTYPIRQVDFYASGSLIGTSTMTPYSLTWSNVAAGNYVLTAVATDSQGNRATSTDIPITVAAGPVISLDDGMNGAAIPDDTITITGTVQSDGNTGISISGLTGVVDDFGHWAVNHVPLATGMNNLTVTATTVDGVATTASLSVTRTGTNPFVIQATPQITPGPATFNLSLTNRAGASVKKIELDADGSGTYEDISTLGDLFSLQVTTQRLILPTLRITEVDDTVYSLRLGLVVEDPQALYQRAKGVVDSMITRLKGRDIVGATNRITESQALDFTNMFTALDQAGALASSAAAFGAVTSGTLGNDLVELLLVRGTGDSQQAYWIYLIRGDDGIWRIDSM